MHQSFHGATELLRVQCADGLVLTIRTESRARDSEMVDWSSHLRTQSLSVNPREATDVFPSIRIGRHRSAAALGQPFSCSSLTC